MGKDLALLYELSLQKLTYSLLRGRVGEGWKPRKLNKVFNFLLNEQ